MRSIITKGLAINAPGWFARPEFITWLNSGRIMTWHQGGEPTEWSDVLFLVDLSKPDGGLDENLPTSIRNEIIELCRERVGDKLSPIPVTVSNVDDLSLSDGAYRADLRQALTLQAPDWLDDPDFVRWANETKALMARRSEKDPSQYRDVVVFVDPSVNGEGSDSDMPEHIWDAIIEDCRNKGLGPARIDIGVRNGSLHFEPQMHIAVRITRDGIGLDPRLEAAAKAYYEELMESHAGISRSHFTWMKIVSEFGEQAAENALAPYFEAEEDAARRANWEIVKKFYAEHDMAPGPSHPERPADEPPTERLGLLTSPEALSNQPSFAARKEYCEKRFEWIGTKSDRWIYDIGDGMVLKVATSDGGVAQNKIEADVAFAQAHPDIINAPIASSKDAGWVVAPLLEPVNRDEIADYYGTSWYRFNLYLTKVAQYVGRSRAGTPAVWPERPSIARDQRKEVSTRWDVIDRLLAEFDGTAVGFSDSRVWGRDPATGALRITDYGMTHEVFGRYYRPDVNDEPELGR